ncbi:PREDICTED: glutaredoxin domain-containing cysteine-rich protein CG12206 [Ipomoea nil]|uniref:glutaredoxin domain-containing cysteine-rich protein CG12206 n=1 Tax=Ipomoea nil TaxID=35883 RepID=UPI000901C064|nr:PREDICTED: glutaredoxin domain-containing cysteine-rich protein CG12206 [Ipomoea nil]XP_019160387.1 PREDICTED: glutaredoxin domain-containing cysteine-rich protein CG12206 [Ipomoea nil]
MGCASSKRIKATVDVYRPPPSSFAVFDVNDVEEPWLMNGKAAGDMQDDDDDEKKKEAEKIKAVAHVPPPLLEKLNSIEEAPRSWDEVSKALEDLKPTLNSTGLPPAVQNTKDAVTPPPAAAEKKHSPPKPKKSSSFHTVEELDAKLTPKPAGLTKTESMKVELKKSQSPATESQPGSTRTEGFKSVKDNIFLVRDRMEKEKDGKPAAAFIKRDPLSDFPEKCPPGGETTVVLYTTSLGGVRRTFEDCNNVRAILESHRVVFDERDVALHGEFRGELRELLGEGFGGVPRLFVKGRYVGGAEEVVGLNDAGRLGRILSWARVERGVGNQGCEGCGGVRFVPCLDCGGSCKIVNGDKKERCGECNENGLVQCPICH